MNWQGIVVGLAAFGIIGIFHPIVIKGEYYFGQKLAWLFLLLGLSAIAAATIIQDVMTSSLLSVLGFSLFWSILELKHQKSRVDKGWFPKGPSHPPKNTTDKIRSRKGT